MMEDKEAVIKELAELKKSKKEKDEDKLEAKKEKKIAKTDNTEDVLGIMSQLTSLMISQQQQQMLMMTQMFSMFQAQQPKQQSYYSGFSPMSDYISPYAFNASSFEFPRNESPYSLSGFNSRVGLNSDYGRSYLSYDRAPASQRDYGTMFDRSYLDNSEESAFQPQILQPRSHNGFNFSSGTNAMDMQKVQF
ncbi:MAG: hypothetical protein H7336_05150 [Bacteriovorax sp.]|nr:hypothetical protein [Bacteriovorax sp.]